MSSNRGYTRSDYTRLIRRRRRATKVAVSVPRSSLLLGADHILKVDSSLYSEEYKRYFFRDIRMITIKTNARRLVWNLILSFLVVLSLVVVFGNSALDASTVIMAIVGVPSAVLLIINNALGPTCDVRIQTAVQTDDLAPLSRVRRANRALEKLRPLIAQAQGQFTAEETAQRLRELTMNAGAKAATSPLNL